jgi:hypothetical protein
MFRPCLAIFRSQCWCAQMRKNTVVCRAGSLLPGGERRGCIYTLWPDDCQARPKYVVAIAAINTLPRQLCFWRTLLPSFNIRKHNGDDETEDYDFLIFLKYIPTFLLTALIGRSFWWRRTVSFVLQELRFGCKYNVEEYQPPEGWSYRLSSSFLVHSRLHKHAPPPPHNCRISVYRSRAHVDLICLMGLLLMHIGPYLLFTTLFWLTVLRWVRKYI